MKLLICKCARKMDQNAPELMPQPEKGETVESFLKRFEDWKRRNPQ